MTSRKMLHKSEFNDVNRIFFANRNRSETEKISNLFFLNFSEIVIKKS